MCTEGLVRHSLLTAPCWSGLNTSDRMNPWVAHKQRTTSCPAQGPTLECNHVSLAISCIYWLDHVCAAELLGACAPCHVYCCSACCPAPCLCSYTVTASPPTTYTPPASGVYPAALGSYCSAYAIPNPASSNTPAGCVSVCRSYYGASLPTNGSFLFIHR